VRPRTSLIEEGSIKHVRMANLAIVGSHSTNGVRRSTPPCSLDDGQGSGEMFPERFSNKTTG